MRNVCDFELHVYFINMKSTFNNEIWNDPSHPGMNIGPVQV